MPYAGHEEDRQRGSRRWVRHRPLYLALPQGHCEGYFAEKNLLGPEGHIQRCLPIIRPGGIVFALPYIVVVSSNVFRSPRSFVLFYSHPGLRHLVALDL